MPSPDIFAPFTINKVRFRNRVIRSSIGGRNAYYDGTVNDAFAHFERRFAVNNIGGMISATFTVDHSRWSPLEYPAMSSDEFIKPLQRAIRYVKHGQPDMPYILQIGDPGYHTQTSLFSEEADEASASKGFDILYGYRDMRAEMPEEQIEETISRFARAAVRARLAGCDGVEVTVSKGYLIHQFLNPRVNHRTDQYGGSLENRFRFLQRVANAVRRAIGPDFLFGIRISARDYNHLPWIANLFRTPRSGGGNGLAETIQIGKWLREPQNGAIDYLHISNGFGFINPKENPGRFPTKEAQIFLNSTRHLGRKSSLRATAVNVFMFLRLADPLLNIGWNFVPAANLPDAAEFKRALGVDFPIIVNGAFQEKWEIEQALSVCDFVSMARPLLANPDLPTLLERNRAPTYPCTHCNRCTLRTTLFPLGCYDLSRFDNLDQMQDQILTWGNSPMKKEYRTLPIRAKPPCIQPEESGPQVNFGGNVFFKPDKWYAPRNPQEILHILKTHRGESIRVIGSRHAWSEAAQTNGVNVDMRHFENIELREVGDGVFVKAGAGCTLSAVLHELDRHGYTLPTIGTITKQTVAGAISTGTHGAGNSSLSDHAVAITVAAYDESAPRIYSFTRGDELRAARCAVGCMGIILDVTLPCVKKFYVAEAVRQTASLDDVLASEPDFPLLEFGLLPYRWSYIAYQRVVVQRREMTLLKRPIAWAYRAYKTIVIDWLAHASLKWFVVPLSQTRFGGLPLLRFTMQRIMPFIVALWPIHHVVDRNTKTLTRHHDLFQHVEMEVFVPRASIKVAIEFIREMTSFFAGEAKSISEKFEDYVPYDYESYRGYYAHHYVLYVRRVLPDDTLISMTARNDRSGTDYYGIGFFSFHEPSRERFKKYAECIATGLNRMCRARVHWGKYFPLTYDHMRDVYPELDTFASICKTVDPNRSFRNSFTGKVLNL
jgi:2,4-dienoyl-CoA reductase-like NADH-dependent reductase (Old Yellow Enzyme family)